MFHRRPLGLTTITNDAGGALARLTALDGFARGILVGIVPLLALEALGSKEAVAHAYLLAAIFTLCVTLNFSVLERVLQRRWVMSLASLFLMTAASLLYWGSGIFFALGIGMRSAAASLFSVCLSLYIMEYITKQHLAHSESRRMFFNGGAWLIAPVLGTWLWNNHFSAIPFLLSVLAACGTVSYFWWLRMGKNQIITAAKRRPASPLKVVPRYFKQKRLRMAYFITLIRSCFWVTVFVYGPIYIVEAGLPQWLAGVFLSAASALLFFSPLIRRAAEKFSIRRVIIFALTLTGSACIVLGSLQQATPWGIAWWLIGAIGGACLDVLGNIPFMRNVKPYERSEMTMIFSTWREMSELLTPLIISLTTLLLPFYAFYYLLGIGFFTVALYSTFHLPRRL